MDTPAERTPDMDHIGEHTRLPLKLVIALFASAATLAGSAAVGQFQIRDNAARVEKLEAVEREHDRRIQRSEDLGSEVREQLKEMRQDVKELLRRRDP